MKRGGQIKAIIFDVGGVLQLGGKTRFSKKEIHTSGVHEVIAKKLKISLDQYFDSIDSAYSKSMEGQISKQKLLEILSLNLGVSKLKLSKLYYQIYRKKYHQNKKLISLAKNLKRKGYLVAILSDQWHLSNDALIPKKWEEIFNPIISSCNEGMRKPTKPFFDLLFKKIKLAPNETVFIDNQHWNIVAANNFGMKTILFKNNLQTKEQLKHFGVDYE